MKAASAERYCSKCGVRNAVGNRVGNALICRRCYELIPQKIRAWYRMKAERLAKTRVNP